MLSSLDFSSGCIYKINPHYLIIFEIWTGMRNSSPKVRGKHGGTINTTNYIGINCNLSQNELIKIKVLFVCFVSSNNNKTIARINDNSLSLSLLCKLRKHMFMHTQVRLKTYFTNIPPHKSEKNWINICTVQTKTCRLAKTTEEQHRQKSKTIWSLTIYTHIWIWKHTCMLTFGFPKNQLHFY